MIEQGTSTSDKRFLVVMSNRDVYYANQEDAMNILAYIQFGTDKVYRFKDVKTGNKVSVNVAQVSSLVEPSGTNRGAGYGSNQ